jgi:hypothetical protein
MSCWRPTRIRYLGIPDFVSSERDARRSLHSLSAKTRQVLTEGARLSFAVNSPMYQIMRWHEQVRRAVARVASTGWIDRGERFKVSDGRCLQFKSAGASSSCIAPFADCNPGRLAVYHRVVVWNECRHIVVSDWYWRSVHLLDRWRGPRKYSYHSSDRRW